jgi:hypothetical protein
VADLRVRGPAALALADLNNDGTLDIITAGFRSSTVNVILRNLRP